MIYFFPVAPSVGGLSVLLYGAAAVVMFIMAYLPIGSKFDRID